MSAPGTETVDDPSPAPRPRDGNGRPLVAGRVASRSGATDLGRGSVRLPGPWAWTRLMALAVVLVAVLPFALVQERGLGAGSGLLLLVTTWTGLRLSWLVCSGRLHLFDFTFQLFTYLFLGLAPLGQLSLGSFPSTTPGVDRAYQGTGTAVVLLGVAAWELGRLLGRGRGGAGRLQFGQVRAGRTSAYTAASLLMASAFVVAIGPSYFVGNRTALSTRRSEIFGDSLGVLALAFAVIPLLTAVHALLSLRRQHAERVDPAWLVVSGTMLILLVNPISSPRYLLGTVYLSLLWAAGGFATRRRTRVSFAVVVAALVVVFPYADAFRSAEVALGGPSPIEALAVSGDYEAYAQIVTAAELYDAGVLEPGRQALGVVLFFVPRSQWPEKPLDTGTAIAQAKGYGFINISSPLWAEAYVNGGFLAVVVVFFAVSAGAARADARSERRLASRGRQAVHPLYGILPFYMFILLRGSLLQAMSFLAVLLLVAGTGRWLVHPGGRFTGATGGATS